MLLLHRSKQTVGQNCSFFFRTKQRAVFPVLFPSQKKMRGQSKTKKRKKKQKRENTDNKN